MGVARQAPRSEFVEARRVDFTPTHSLTRPLVTYAVGYRATACCPQAVPAQVQEHTDFGSPLRHASCGWLSRGWEPADARERRLTPIGGPPARSQAGRAIPHTALTARRSNSLCNGVAAWNGMVPLVVIAVPLGGAAALICRAASCAASAHGATRSVESGRLQPQRAAQCWRS